MTNQISKSGLPPGWKLPDAVRRRLGSKAGRQRVIAEGDDILLILHKPPIKQENARESVFFWRDSSKAWNSSERGSGLGALHDFIEKYAKLGESLEEEFENAKDSQDFFELLGKLAPIHRSVKNMCKALQSAREYAGVELIDYRDRAEELNRHFELLNIDSKNGLDYAVAKKSEEQSELQRKALLAGHRLNMVIALFLPITAAASLLGMNIPHGLEKSPTWVYFSIVCVCGVLGLFVRYMISRKE